MHKISRQGYAPTAWLMHNMPCYYELTWPLRYEPSNLHSVCLPFATLGQLMAVPPTHMFAGTCMLVCLHTWCIWLTMPLNLACPFYALLWLTLIPTSAVMRRAGVYHIG